MQINYDFPWYLQNSEGFMTLYTGLFDTAKTISPITFLDCFDIDNVEYPQQIKTIAMLYGLRGDWVGIEDALIYNINEWSVEDQVENYWSGKPADSLVLLKNYIKAKVQIRNKNLTLQSLKQFFTTCLAHRNFNPSTDISVTESTLHFDLTVSVDTEVLNDMVTLLSVDPWPFGKPTGISYSINYVQQ